MKLSLGTWAFTFGPYQHDPWNLTKVLEFTAWAGYDGVELNGFRPHPHQDDFGDDPSCRELAGLIESYGLGISGYAPDFSSVPPALVGTSVYVQQVEKCLAFCQRLGISTLRLDTVSAPESISPESYEKKFTQLVRTWHASAVAAERSGVTIVWEFEPGFWLNKPSEVKRLVQAVAHPNFKVLFDSSHAYMGAVIGARQTGKKELLPGGVTEYAILLQEYIGHLHLIDSDGSLHDHETSTHTHFGEGKVDFKALLTAVKPTIASLPWWGIDYCFNADVEKQASEAVPFVCGVADEVFGNQSPLIGMKKETR